MSEKIRKLSERYNIEVDLRRWPVRWRQQRVEILKALARMPVSLCLTSLPPCTPWTRPAFDTLRDGVAGLAIIAITHKLLEWISPPCRSCGEEIIGTVEGMISTTRLSAMMMGEAKAAENS